MSLVKIVVLGESGVGKSSYTIRYAQDVFVNDYDPTIENSYRKQFTYENTNYMADILDTGGEEEYSVMRDSYIRASEGIVLAFSLTCKRSFDALGAYCRQIERVKDTNNTPIVLIGTKCDLTKYRVISNEDIEELANELGCNYFITSAKDDINITESFQHIFERTITYKNNNQKYDNNMNIHTSK